jgi:hypothetical protein
MARRQLGPQFSTDGATAPTAAPQPTTEPAEPLEVAPAAPTNVAPSTTGAALATMPDVSDSAIKLASTLAQMAGGDSEQTTSQTDPTPPGLMAVFTAPAPVDPDLDLIASGLRWPKYVATAVRAVAYAKRRSMQSVALDALLGREPLPPELLDECRRAHRT